MSRKSKVESTVFSVSAIQKQTLSELRTAAKPGRAAYEKAYLKSSLEFIGAPVAAHHACAKRLVREYRDLPCTQLLELANAMWATRVHEMRSVAVLVMIQRSDLLRRSDLPFLRRWVIESDGWALVDSIACHLLPQMVAVDPRVLSVMDKWSVDKNFWVRRAAMLSLLQGLRNDGFPTPNPLPSKLRFVERGLWERFVRYATPQLTEKEFFIRKAIGWIMREVSKKNPDAVFEFLSTNRAAVAGLTLREGAKYLPVKQRRALGL